VSKAAFGEGAVAGKTWVQALLPALEQGQLAKVLERLEVLAVQQESTAPHEAEAARKAASYFKHRSAQVAYPHFVAAGYQIGIGLAESASKRFGTDRMKGVGMRWTIKGARSMATLRAFVLP
jgi:hypothetical protein